MAFTPATPLEAVEALYIGYFGRAGEPGGVQYWVDQIQAGRTFAQVAAAFSVQAEAKATHPFLANPDLVSPADFIESLYVNLLERASDATGKAYWVAQANAAQGNPFAYGLLVAQFISGAQGDDITTLQNKIDAAEYFTGKLAAAGISGVDSSGQVLPDVDSAATSIIGDVTKDTATVTAAATATDTFVSGGGGAGGTTFTLTKTTGEQIKGTAANDIVNAIVGGADATLNTFDNVQGGGGTDTFNVVVAAAAPIPAQATVNGFEIINLDMSAAGITNLNTASFGGATQVWEIGGLADITVGAGVTVGFRDTALGADIKAATGVSSITVALDNVTAGGTVEFFETTAGDLKTVTVNGDVATNGAVTVDTGTNTTKVGTINLGLTSDGVVTLVTDSAKIATIDASTSTGDLTIDISAAAADALTLLENFKGGSGGDTLSVSIDSFTKAAATVNAGAGDDVINVDIDALNGGGTTATALTLTGGAGADRFVLTTADDGNLVSVASAASLAASLVIISDFESAVDVLDISSAALAPGARAVQNDVNAAVSGAADLLEAVTAAQGVTAAGGFAVFAFDNNTYIYADSNSGALDAGDTLIQLTGVAVSGLTAANFVS